MPGSPYTGNPAGPIVTTFTIPDDGDEITAASVNTDFQPMADNFARIKNANVYSAARVLNGVWQVSGATGTSLFDMTVPVSQTAGIPLSEIPNGATITAVSVKISPAVHASLPGTMPKVNLFTITAAGVATFQTVTDPSPNTTVYNATHDIVLTLSPSITVDRTANLYLLQFAQEHGTNSADGVVVTGSVTIS